MCGHGRERRWAAFFIRHVKGFRDTGLKEDAYRVRMSQMPISILWSCRYTYL